MAGISRDVVISLPSRTSPSSTWPAIEQRRSDRGDAYYRREEVVDGNSVRVIEAPRRHRSASRLLSASDGRQITSPSSSSPLWRSTRDALPPKCKVESLAVAESPMSSKSPSGDDVGRLSTHQSGYALVPGYDEFLKRCDSKLSIDDTSSQSSLEPKELPSMPLTPRPSRLPTPDLPPLKMEVFCPCCSYRTGPIDLWAEFEDETLGGVGVLDHRASWSEVRPVM